MGNPCAHREKPALCRLFWLLRLVVSAPKATPVARRVLAQRMPRVSVVVGTRRVVVVVMASHRPTRRANSSSVRVEAGRFGPCRRRW